MAISEYCNMQNRLAGDGKEHNPKLIAGDFNTWAEELGICETNEGERIILEVFSCLNIPG